MRKKSNFFCGIFIFAEFYLRGIITSRLGKHLNFARAKNREVKMPRSLKSRIGGDREEMVFYSMQLKILSSIVEAW